MYRIRPFRMYGQPTFATRAGAILQKAIMPFGVEGGTRSRAAERMMTYNTGNAINSNVVAEREWIPLTIIDESKQKEGCAQFEE